MVKGWIQTGAIATPIAPQGVTKERITQVLNRLDRFTADIRDAVFALLDEQTNWYKTAPDDLTFADGACTAHIGAHVAILQRESDAKLDREGRDYWIKPLREVGAIEPCYLPSTKDKALLSHGNKFYDGHPKAKSPNNAYRLSQSFVHILKAPDDAWEQMLAQWVSEDKVRTRLDLQAKAAEVVRKLTDNSHSEVIKAGAEFYAPKFLPGYKVIYIDDGDGDRITDEQKQLLKCAGLEIDIADAMPDILFWNEESDMLWVYEAVTSDGEVDLHKVSQLNAFCKRFNKAGIGYTTAYPTWKKAAERQKKTGNNLAINSYMWIVEDAAKQYKVEG